MADATALHGASLEKNRKTLHILDLPIEIQTKILSHLCILSQMNTIKVCQTWSEIIRTAPTVVAKRYTHMQDPDILSTGAQLHRLFANETTNKVNGFTIVVDLKRKKVLSWVLKHYNGKLNYQKIIKCSGRIASREYKKIYADDIADCPFLDEPVITMKNTKFVGNPETMRKGNPGPQSKKIRLFNPSKFRINPKFVIGTEDISYIFPTDWSVGAEDFESDANADSAKIPISIRDMVEGLIDKMKQKTDSGDRGYFASQGRGICECHSNSSDDEVHPSWKGAKIDVTMSMDGLSDDGWVISAYATNLSRNYNYPRFRRKLIRHQIRLAGGSEPAWGEDITEFHTSEEEVLLEELEALEALQAEEGKEEEEDGKSSESRESDDLDGDLGIESGDEADDEGDIN